MADDELSKRYPGVAVSLREFEDWAGGRATATPERRTDLYLAFACSRGDPAALAALDAQVMPRVAASLTRFGDADFGKDVCQQVRERLLIATGAETPRISEYRGQGPLFKFVQVVAVRLALNLLETSPNRNWVRDDGAVLDAPARGAEDPELALMKAKYRGDFKAAFAAAMAQLEDEPRTALRLHYLDGLTLADLGQLYGWSVPTASRRVAAARARVLEATRRLLGERLKLSPAELDSVLRLIESRLTIEPLAET
jgi:RNA polymerase sigma-70 factor (ECF subfamily)